MTVHRAWQVAYNPVYDQLLLTGGSDGRVNVLSAATVASLNPAAEAGEPRRLGDGLLYTFEQHEESVYGVCWSAAEPWVHASVSYDGRVCVGYVPRDIKFELLSS